MAFLPALRAFAGRARLYRALPVLLLALPLLTACKKPEVKDPNNPNFIVAGAATPTGTWTITRADLNKQIDDALSQQGATRDQIPPAQVPYIETKMLRFMVLKKLLLDKAATMKLPDVDKEVAEAVDYAKNRDPQHTYTDDQFAALLKSHGLTLDQWKQNLRDIATMQAVISAESSKDTAPSEQEIDAIYNSHQDAFKVPPMIRASRVLILVGEGDTAAQKAAKKKQIDAAHARVVKGEEFSKVAMEVSQDRSSAPKGGDMGKFPRGTNEAGFDDVAFKTKVNSISPVFLDSLGYQFVKVTDSTPEGVISLAEARSIIGPKLAEAKQRQNEASYVQNLLTKSGVNFYLKLVDPPAQMPGLPPGAGGPGGPAGPGGESAPGAPAPDTSSAPPPPPTPANANLPAPELSATNSAPGQ